MVFPVPGTTLAPIAPVTVTTGTVHVAPVSLETSRLTTTLLKPGATKSYDISTNLVPDLWLALKLLTAGAACKTEWPIKRIMQAISREEKESEGECMVRWI
jgi:hypothetical protein